MRWLETGPAKGGTSQEDVNARYKREMREWWSDEFNLPGFSFLLEPRTWITSAVQGSYSKHKREITKKTVKLRIVYDGRQSSVETVNILAVYHVGLHQFFCSCCLIFQHDGGLVYALRNKTGNPSFFLITEPSPGSIYILRSTFLRVIGNFSLGLLKIGREMASLLKLHRKKWNVSIKKSSVKYSFLSIQFLCWVNNQLKNSIW